jgi:tetratricopeptide (TPR) repeat protein
VVDLDEASQRYRDAYALVGSGRFEEAVALLDHDLLDKELGSAIASKQRGSALIAEANAEIARLVDSYSLKAQILETSMRFRDALRAMDERQRIMDEQPDAFSVEEVISARAETGRMLCTLGEYTDAVRVLEAALQEARVALSSGSAAFPGLYNALSLAKAELGEYPVAVQYADTGSRMAMVTFGTSDPRTGELLYQLGQSQLKAGDYATARKNFKLAWTTWQPVLEPNDPRFGKAMGSIGMTHYHEGGLGFGRVLQRTVRRAIEASRIERRSSTRRRPIQLCRHARRHGPYGPLAGADE